MRHYRATPQAGETRASIDDILAAVRVFDPSAAPTTITWRRDVAAPASVVLGTRTLHMNPYNATVYGEGTGQSLRVQREDIDRMVDRAMSHTADWTTVTLRLPTSTNEPMAFTIDGGDAPGSRICEDADHHCVG